MVRFPSSPSFASLISSATGNARISFVIFCSFVLLSLTTPFLHVLLTNHCEWDSISVSDQLVSAFHWRPFLFSPCFVGRHEPAVNSYAISFIPRFDVGPQDSINVEFNVVSGF